MPSTFQEGDAVQIADRDPVAADTKSQLFYTHYRGVRGTLSKLYADGTALVIADTDTLPADARTRHTDGTDAMRRKWLDGLSEEGRGRLSAAEKKFALRYSVLVSQSDLRAGDGTEAQTSVPAATTDTAGQAGADAAPRRTMEEIQADEDRHLSEARKQKSRG